MSHARTLALSVLIAAPLGAQSAPTRHSIRRASTGSSAPARTSSCSPTTDGSSGIRSRPRSRAGARSTSSPSGTRSCSRASSIVRRRRRRRRPIPSHEEARHVLRELHGLDVGRARRDRADRRRAAADRRHRGPRAAAGRVGPHALARLRRRVRLRRRRRIRANATRRHRVRHAGRARTSRSRLLSAHRRGRAVDADALPARASPGCSSSPATRRRRRRRARHACSTSRRRWRRRSCRASRCAIRTRGTII